MPKNRGSLFARSSSALASSSDFVARLRIPAIFSAFRVPGPTSDFTGRSLCGDRSFAHTLIPPLIRLRWCTWSPSDAAYARCCRRFSRLASTFASRQPRLYGVGGQWAVGSARGVAMAVTW